MSQIMMMPAHDFVLALSMAVGILLVFGGLFGGMSFRLGWRFLDLVWDWFFKLLRKLFG